MDEKVESTILYGVWFNFLLFKRSFEILKNYLREVSLRLFFILEKDLLKRNFTITLISIIKNNFTLSYPKKTYFPKYTFDIFKLNKNYFLKIISLKDLFQKIFSKKLNQTYPLQLSNKY